MAYNNNIMFIRYQLLARLVKMWKENELLEKIDRLPVELHPRKQNRWAAVAYIRNVR